MSKHGLFVLSYPVLEDASGLYFGDECYRYTIEQCRPFIDEAWIIARRRKVPQVSGKRSELKEMNARLMLELPDFGSGGRTGWMNLFRLRFGLETKKSLARLMGEADFTYVEAPSLEAWLVALTGRRVARPLIMEMRGEMVLNRDYMKARFGLKGMAYVWLLHRLFGVIRKQAIAGLYVNRSLLQRYPVSGGHREVISDVHLPDHIFRGPRTITSPARNFLYVGTLEKIKQIDLILKVLNRIKDRLPSDWMFQIVGDGPEMEPLIELTGRLGIKPHVSFCGRIEWGEPLFTFYRESDLLLMASRSEGASRTLMEAMAFALPVISTEAGTAVELLDPRVLVKTGGDLEYGERLISVALDPDLLAGLSCQNWQRAQDFRGSELTVKREAFYAKAIEMSSRSKKGPGCLLNRRS